MDSEAPRKPKVPALLLLAGFVVVVAGVKAAGPLLVPFFLAVFVAVICTPPLFWMQRKGVPKIAALAAILLVILSGGLLFGLIIGPSLTRFLSSLPEYQHRLSEQFAGMVGWLRDQGLDIPEEQVSAAFDPGWVMGLAGSILSALSSVLGSAFLIFLTVIFILMEVAGFPRKLRLVLRDPEKSLATIERFSREAKRYLVIKTLVSAFEALVIGVWLLILGVDYPVLWAALVFLLNFIPNIGSIIAALPPALLALVQNGVGSALLVLFGFGVANLAIGNLLEPRMMGRGLSLSPLVVFLSLVFWGWILGPMGMVLSVPITSLVKILLETQEHTRGLAALLGDDDEKAKAG